MTPERLKEIRVRSDFWAKVDRSDGCWLWMGPISSYGYGIANDVGRKRMAHRIAYEQTIGPIPDGLVIDHLCRVRRCVNPAHMEPVESKENVLRGIGPSAIAARATACPRGHTYDEANTYRWRGERHCRICSRERSNERQRRRVICAECSQEIAWGALARHKRRNHAA